MADWRVTYLRALGAPATPANLGFLAKWQPWEGGMTHNSARWNYFNTTQRMPGSHAINAVGVQSYASLAQGAQAFAKTLLGNVNYRGLVSGLRGGDPSHDAVAALSTWVSGRPDSAQGVAYANKILGSHVSTGNFNVTDTGAGATAKSEAPGAGPGAQPFPQGAGISPQQEQAKIRQAAVGGLQGIVRGEQPTSAFGDVAGMIQSLRQAAASYVNGTGPTARPATPPGPAGPTGTPSGLTGPVGKPVKGGKVIGTPYTGTHAKAFNVAGGSDNWESENANDIAIPVGTPIYAVADGTIGSQFGSLGQGGRFAGLRLHLVGARNEWYYAHLSKFAPGLQPGMHVHAGQLLGYSGEANGVAHLHIAARSGAPPV